MNRSARRIAFLLFGVFCASILFYGETGEAYAASLYLSPSHGAIAVGSTFTVSVYVDTEGQAVNAIQADLTFPTDKLQVVSPDSGKSLIQTWVTQPAYSNSQGTLRFAGAIPSPGINTSEGLISTITFRAVGAGAAVIKFTDNSKVLLNDGLGTDALSQSTNGVYTMTLPPPAGPTVTSPTNPDQGKWYKGDAAVLNWVPPTPDTEGYSYSLSDTLIDTPDNVSEGNQTSVTYNNLPDGIHYFHIKALRGGKWGGVTNYTVRVDNTPPAAFDLNVLPSDVTADQDVIFQFDTTDAASGIDHYDIRIISLNPSLAHASGSTPFAVDAGSPYLQHFDLGRYSVVVRAYDNAGNFYQATQDVSIVSPLLQMAGRDGLRIAGSVVVEWPYVISLSMLLVLFLGFVFRMIWRWHRDLEERVARGVEGHPEIAAKLAELRQKQREYEELLKKLGMILLIFSTVAQAALSLRAAHAAELFMDPPIINLYPSALANDEALYLGGWANVPSSTVEIFIQQTETGNTFTGAAITGSDGNWFYSFPQLLDSGHYAVWAELSQGEVKSPPSPRVDITVSPTALKIGSMRFDYAELYFTLFVIFLAIAAVLTVLIVIFLRKAGQKRAALAVLVREAEESLRRGFSLLHHDIEKELAAIRELKLRGALSDAEREREEKLLHDFDAVKSYIGKEIWKIGEER